MYKLWHPSWAWSYHNVQSVPCNCGNQALVSVYDETNQNLTNGQKELLLLHQHLVHLSFERCQKLMTHCANPRERGDKDCTPCIKPRDPRAATCQSPLCAACQLGRATRKGPGTSTSSPVQEKLGGVVGTNKDIEPGEVVSMDQYVCSVRGRLPFKWGREKESLRYGGGTIFVDHASGFIFVNHQVSFTAAETITSKDLFEQKLRHCGVVIKSYHTDNGVFKVQEFSEASLLKINRLVSQASECTFRTP